VLRIVLAVVGILVGVGVLIAGAGALYVEQASGAFLNAGEGRAPGEVRFVAEDRDYTVHLGSGATDSLRNDARCTVRRGNESVVKLRGDRGGVSVSGRTVGTFQGVPGTTRVECTFVERDLDNVSARFYVSPQREWLRTTGFVLIGLGVVVILGSTALIVTGRRPRSA
jgi:hypothetical protein